MEKYKDFNIGDVYYIPSNDFYVYIFVDKSNSTRLNDIKILLVILVGYLLMD